MHSNTRHITIQDIAAEVGVSKSAVSLALNNKPGISDGLRQRIFDVASSLGYQQRQPLVPLSPTQNRSITAVFQYGRSSTVVDDYTALHSMSAEWLRGIRTYLQEQKSNLTFIEAARSGEISYLGRQMIHDKTTPLDGLILMGPGVNRESDLVQYAVETNIPVSIICRNWPELTINTVGQSYRQQARIALNHLIDLGHEQIAFVARKIDQGYEWFDERWDEFQTIIRSRFGLDPARLLFINEDEESLTDQILNTMPKVTAIFALHDTMGFRLLEALNRKGIRVPHDISVIGQDDTKPKRPPPIGLTTIGYDHFQVGYLAAEILFDQLLNPTIHCSKITLKSELIERGSCQPI